MKKLKLIGLIVAIVVLVGLIIFASVHKNSDSHLRVDGIRIWVNEGALLVDGCDESDAIHCKKTIKVAGKAQTLEFNFQDFKENGYPNSISAKINGQEFYYSDGLDIENNGSYDYKIFLNFEVIADKYIAFTFTDGTAGRTTTLYIIDTEGNIKLQLVDLDEDDMLIKDYTNFIEYDDNVITLYGTRVIEDINYEGQSICYAPDDDIVEAYYTITYNEAKDTFTKKLKETITAEKFIEDKGIICNNKEE